MGVRLKFPCSDIGYVFANGDFRKFEQRASIKSAPFPVPRDAVLDFLVFMSEPDAGRLSLVYHYPARTAEQPNAAAGQTTNVIWQATGYKAFGEEGWRRVRVPLPAFNFPVAVRFFEIHIEKL